MIDSHTSVVITCRELGHALREAVGSVAVQTWPAQEIVVVDDGSQDSLTRQILAVLEQGVPPVRVLRSEHRGPAHARNLGIGSTTAPLVALLDGDQLLEPTYLEHTSGLLWDRPDLSFVSCSLTSEADSGRRKPPPYTVGEALGRGASGHVAPVFRRQVWELAGGFDEQLADYDDVDFWLRAIELGVRGVILDQALAPRRVNDGSRHSVAAVSGEQLRARMMLFEKHLEPGASRGEEVFATLLDVQRELSTQARSLDHERMEIEQALTTTESEISRAREALADRGAAVFDWGAIGMGEKLSSGGGVDAVSQHFIRRALDDLVPSPSPTRTITIRAGDPWPDTHRPAFDLIVVDGALETAGDPAAAIARCHAALRPGGQVVVAAATVPRTPGQQRGLTEASLRGLLCSLFPPAQVHVTSYGNLLTCLGSAARTSMADLAAGTLEIVDPGHPTVVAASARLPGRERSMRRRHVVSPPSVHRVSTTPRRGAILSYHRIAASHLDTHGLCTPPEVFATQMECLAECFHPLSLPELVAQATAEELIAGAVAVTFDDGYLDNLDTASPTLAKLGIPVTFFVSGTPPEEPAEPWWDTVERILLGQQPVPDRLVLEFGARRLDLPIRTAGERRAALLTLHGELLEASSECVRTVVSALAEWSGVELPVRDSHRLMTAAELAQLSGQPGHQIGAQVRHRALAGHPVAQADELRASKAKLEGLVGGSIDAVAYRYRGSDFATTQIAQDAGFTIGCTVESDSVTADSDPLRLPRVEVREQDLRGFRARMTQMLVVPR